MLYSSYKRFVLIYTYMLLKSCKVSIGQRMSCQVKSCQVEVQELNRCVFLCVFILAFDFCRFCVVIRFFHPATTVNDLRFRRIFYPRFYSLHLFTYLNSWETASECSVLNKGTTGTIFITSLVWRGPWLGIEPGTSRTRSQHFTTRLSRRQ